MKALKQKKVWLALAASTLALGGCVTGPVQTTTFDETVLLDAPSSYELPLGPTQVTGSGSYYSNAPRSDWGRYDERYADNYYRDTYGNSGYYAQDAGLDQFAWLDLAYDVTDEIGSNAPDFSFRFDGRQSFAWQTWDGYKLYAEPIAGGYRYYYFGPNSDRPFLVRDPLYSFAYRYGRLVAVYDRDGRILNYNAANRLLGEATYFYRLGREIDSAARYGAGRVSATPLWLTWQNDYDYDRYRWGRDRYRHGDYDDWRRERRRNRDERGEGRRDRRDRAESREERAERLARERDGRDPNRGRPEGVGGAGGRDAAQLPARSTPILEVGRPEGRRVDAETGRPDEPVANQPRNGSRGDGRADGRRAGREDPAPPAAGQPDRPRRPGQPASDPAALQAERDAMLQAEAERQAMSDEQLRQQLEAERQRRAAAAEAEAREQQAREANARQRAEQARQAEARRQAEQAAAERQAREDTARQQAELARQREAQQQAEAQRQRQAAEQQARQQEAEQANARLRAQQAREAEDRRRADAERQAQAQAQARAQAERQRQEQQAAAQRQAEAQRQAAQRQAEAQREAAQRQAEAQRQAAAAAAAAQRQSTPAPQPVVRTAPPPPAPAPAPATTSTPTPTPAPSSRPATVSRPDRPQREPD